MLLPLQSRFALYYLLFLAMAASAQNSGNTTGLDVATVREFDILDRNRDGKLEKREFAFSEIADRFDAAGKATEIDKVFSSINTNKNEGIELLELVKAQQTRTARLLDRENGRNFIKLDVDQDGFIRLDEYMQRPAANPEIFNRIDLNGSKKVGPFEWLHALGKGIANRDLAVAYSKLDKNEDGSLSEAEFAENPPNAISNSFKAFDLNGNRELGAEEFAKAVSTPAEQIEVPKEIVRMFKDIDRNRDQVISLREFERHLPPWPPPAHPSGIVPLSPEQIFDRMDFDRDREVTLIEFYRKRQPPGANLPQKP